VSQHHVHMDPDLEAHDSSNFQSRVKPLEVLSRTHTSAIGWSLVTSAMSLFSVLNAPIRRDQCPLISATRDGSSSGFPPAGPEPGTLCNNGLSEPGHQPLAGSSHVSLLRRNPGTDFFRRLKCSSFRPCETLYYDGFMFSYNPSRCS